MSYSTLEELKASPEYQAAGIIERQRLQLENFPEPWLSDTKKHIEETIYPEDDVTSNG